MYILVILTLACFTLTKADESEAMLKQYDLPSRQELTVDSVKEVPRIIECISDYFINSQYMALWFDETGKRCNLISCVNPNRLNLPGSDVSAGKLYVRYPTNTLLARGEFIIFFPILLVALVTI